MAAADIVVMTSLYESCAMVPLEAKACGRPFLASDVDGVRDNVRHGVDGILVAPNDSQALAQRLAELIQDPDLRRRIGSAGSEAMATFDSNEITARYLTLIESALASPDQR